MELNKKTKDAGYYKDPNGDYNIYEFHKPANFGWAVLRNVEFQVGRTGKITPVAIFDPINMGEILYHIIVHKDCVKNKMDALDFIIKK